MGFAVEREGHIKDERRDQERFFVLLFRVSFRSKVLHVESPPPSPVADRVVRPSSHTAAALNGAPQIPPLPPLPPLSSRVAARYLTSDAPDAVVLRNHFVFKVGGSSGVISSDGSWYVSRQEDCCLLSLETMKRATVVPRDRRHRRVARPTPPSCRATTTNRRVVVVTGRSCRCSTRTAS